MQRIDATRQWFEFPGATSHDDAVVVPLAALIDGLGARTVAVAGPAGGGKSTLVAALAKHFSSTGRSVLAASLDDFYHSRAKRSALGIEFRAAPGSHDIQALHALLVDARAGVLPLEIPRFDAASDERGTLELVAPRPDLVLIDGWILGLSSMGYQTLLPDFDLIVYLRIPEVLARERRFARERALRDSGGRGYSQAQMERFWQEVLGPGGASWLGDAEAHADLLLDCDRHGELAQVMMTPQLSATLRERCRCFTPEEPAGSGGAR